MYVAVEIAINIQASHDTHKYRLVSYSFGTYHLIVETLEIVL